MFRALTLGQSKRRYIYIYIYIVSTFSWYNPLFYSLRRRRSTLVLTGTSIPLFLSWTSKVVTSHSFSKPSPGNAGDGLDHHRGRAFSTKDRDNDRSSSHCSQQFHGAWWYGSCHNSNLNGKYLHGKHSSYADGINWSQWKGYYYSAARAEMKIRPVDF